MEFHNAFVIDVNTELETLERIFDRYIPTSPDHLFVPTSRLPINELKGQLSEFELGHLSKNSYLPFKCLDFFKHVILSYLYMESIDPEMYYTNDLLKYTTPAMFVDIHNYSITDIVYEYIPSLTNTDLRTIHKLMDSVIYKITDLIKPDHDYIFDITFNLKYTVILIVDNIWRYRFKECREEEEYKKELEDEHNC